MIVDERALQTTPFRETVASRLGVVPNLFCSAPGVSENLWAFATGAYLDSPMPPLFKERLFVHLSKYCEVRYCIVRHAGFLLGHGRPAGDASALPHSVEQLLALLRRPTADARRLQDSFARMRLIEAPLAIPEAESEAESDLFDALTVLFLEPKRAEHAREALRAALGEEQLELVIGFLAYVRAAHYWTENHPDLAHEADVLQMMADCPDLARLLLDPSDGTLRRTSASDPEVVRDAPFAGEEALRTSLLEKEVLLEELQHRVKNNLQVLISTLNLQANRVDDIKVLALFEQARARVHSIAVIHELLDRSTSFTEVELIEHARRLSSELVVLYRVGERVRVDVIGERTSLDIERAVPYGLLLNELISNACKHAFPEERDGTLIISVARRADQLVLCVSDDGVGLSPAFEPSRASTLGLKMVRLLVAQLSGSLSIAGVGGVRAQVEFPVAKRAFYSLG